jgi:hypothetical protein
VDFNDCLSRLLEQLPDLVTDRCRRLVLGEQPAGACAEYHCERDERACSKT